MSSTLSAKEVLDSYFLETRAKLLEIAANLDRFDRAADAHAHRADPRLKFVQDALEILESPASDRAERLQRLYSK